MAKKKQPSKPAKPIDAEHPDFYAGKATVAFEIDAERLRKLFNVDPAWKLRRVYLLNEGGSTDDADDHFMTGGPYRGIQLEFTAKVPGPVRAMEILSGGKTKDA